MSQIRTAAGDVPRDARRRFGAARLLRRARRLPRLRLARLVNATRTPRPLPFRWLLDFFERRARGRGRFGRARPGVLVCEAHHRGRLAVRALASRRLALGGATGRARSCSRGRGVGVHAGRIGGFGCGLHGLVCGGEVGGGGRGGGCGGGRGGGRGRLRHCGRRPLPPFRLPEPLTTAVTKPSSFSGVASKLGQSLRGHAAHLLSHRGRWCRRAAGKGILDARSEGHERRVGHEQMLVIEQRHDGHTHTQRHFVHLRQLLAALVHSFELFDGLVQRGFVRGVLG